MRYRRIREGGCRGMQKGMCAERRVGGFGIVVV